MKLGLGVLVACACVATAHAGTDKALVAPAFTASPKDLLAAAAALPATDAPVAYLRLEHELVYDQTSRGTHTLHYIFVVRTQAGVDDWGTFSRSWSPFYQDKPAVRARVIDPSGRVSELDPALQHDAPAVSESPTVFSDRRDLDAPLPRLQVGSVVEVQVTTTDRVPLLAAGALERFSLAASVPVESTRIVLRAPATSHAKVVQRLVATKPIHTITKGVESWTFDLGRRAANTDDEGSLPSDVIQYPYVGIATGPSWGALARDYRAVVERRIADGPVALPAQLKGPPTLATVHAIVAWLHAQVRYTGIEFGDAAITPWPPAESLKRGFGDCKDKATLLVALLRAAGFRADLALLSTGPGQDVDRDLFGTGDFDHAIVRAVVAGAPVWIDATEDMYRAGTLPLRDQGRRALVIAEDTRDLVLTPRSTSADSLIREVRTWQLAESGPARVTEVSREGGMYEVEGRLWIRDTRAEKVREGLEDYARTEYRGDLESYRTTAPGDLATPFEVTTVVKDANRGWTNREKSEVYLFPSDTLEKLPDYLAKFDPDEPARVHDFEVYRPHRYEIENRIVVPPGFLAPTPAAERTVQLASASFVERQRLDGDTFVVTFTFDGGKARLTPAEIASLQKAMEAFAKEERHLVFPQESWSLADRGRLVEAVAAAQRLIKLHPKEAVHYTQLGRAYLTAGAGQAARRAARKAVELEPTNADAHAFLAWTLRQDSFGRPLGFDHDRAGAIAEYEKAIALDPEAEYIQRDFGHFLELGPLGTTSGGDHVRANAVFVKLLAKQPTADNAIAAARSYLRLGKAADAERVLRSRNSSTLRDALLVAAVALQRGGPAAVAEASQVQSGRKPALEGAGGSLLVLGHYGAVRAVFAEAGTLLPGSPQAMMFGRVTRRPANPRADAAATPVRTVFVDLLHPEVPSRTYWDDTTRREIAGKSMPDAVITQALTLGDDLWADLMWSAIDLHVDGPAKGPWRVTADVFGHKVILYVALDRGTAKVIAERGHPTGLGRHAQRVASDLASVRTLLDWAREDVDAHPSTPRERKFATLWGPGLARDAKAAALAAAVLASAQGNQATLEKCESPIADARAICDETLREVYVEKELWPKLEKLGGSDAGAQVWQAAGLVFQRKFDEADKKLAAVLATAPNDVMATLVRLEIAYGRNRPQDAIAQLEAKLGSATMPMARNNLAWLLVGYELDLPRALQLAQAAALAANDRDDVAHTLATAAARSGELAIAIREEVRAMTLGHRRDPLPHDWLVLGLITEQLGLRDDAIAAFRKAASEPRTASFGRSSADLAKAGLARLGVH